MQTYEEALLNVSRVYVTAVAVAGGRSLARIATIVANRGSFFTALEGGATCSVRNFEKFAIFFRDPANWPNRIIPPEAEAALAGIGRPILQAE